MRLLFEVIQRCSESWSWATPTARGSAKRLSACFRCSSSTPRSPSSTCCRSADLRDVEADLTLVLGGDGAILRVARQMGYRQIPVVGVNLGRLGFLADLNCEEVEALFPRIAQGDYRVTEHLMFETWVELPGTPASPTTPKLGLNEIAIQTGALSRG